MFNASRSRIDRATLRPLAPAGGFLVAAAVVSGVYLTLEPGSLPQSLLYAVLGLAAVLAILIGIRRHRPVHPGPWLLLAAGTALFAAGDVAWTLLAIAGEEPFPSVADIAYVTGYPVLMVAYLSVIAIRVADGDRSGLLDAAILAGAVALAGWVWLVRPVIDAPGDPLALAVSAGYPLGDLVIIAVAIGLLATPGRRGGAFVLALLSLGAQFVADLVYAWQVATDTFVDGGPLDLAWIAAYALVAAAALTPSMRDVAMPHPVRLALLTPVRLGLVTVAMLTGPVLLALHDDRDVGLLAVGTATLSLLVVWRLAMVVAALARDIAARRSLEDELSFRATHDPLTGLANRRHFLERVEAAVAARGVNDPVSVLFLDLDDFKGINDTLGHATGDALLVSVAARIRAKLREGNLAARMGGDEFGILLRADAELAARVARRILDSFREPMTVDGRTLVARGSIGVAQARTGIPVAELLADADIAMYRAKGLGKGTVCIYQPQLRAEVLDRTSLEAELRAAIGRDELAVEYQPILDLRTGRAMAVEALVRWTHPTRGVVPPSVFVPLAEATGLGPALGTRVLDAACAQVAAWRRDLDPELALAVNLAPRQVAGADLVAVVYGAAERSGVPLGAIVVDVTEGALLLDAPEVSANLAALRALGVRVAIDDFGSGYSSLGYLARMPVDILKIDQSFVAQLADGADPGIAGIVVSLAGSLGLEPIAEGIETQAQRDAVLALGCHLGQGYHLAPPSTAAAFEARYRPVPVPDERPGEARPGMAPAPGLPFASGA